MLKGLGNLGNLAGMVQQAQQMGEKMKELQEKLKAVRVTGEGGGGLVVVEMNGERDVLAVRIDPGLVERNEREMIEDLTVAALAAASAKAREAHTEAMQELTGGMNLPGMNDMLAKFTGDQQ